MINEFGKNHRIHYLIFMVIPLSLMVISLLIDSLDRIILGLYSIITSSSILITDYIEVGGFSATAINASILMLINILILYKLDMKFNGPIISALITVFGFSFFGKNLINVWPIYLGTYLYSKYQHIPYKNVIVITMFSTSLAPLVSLFLFGFQLPFIVSLIISMLIGVIMGFILPPLSAHLMKLHEGYNLYNIGLTAGILGTVVAALLRGFGFDILSENLLYTGDDTYLFIILGFIFIYFIIIGFIFNGKSFSGYSNLYSYSGRLITDFIHLEGYGITYINMGIMGFISLLYVYIMGGNINGPIIAGIMTVVAFSAFGKHPKNTIPIMLGVSIASVFKIWDFSATGTIIAGLFGTTLAPIAGTYGILLGLVTGFLHLSVVMNIGIVHGGINLYNNGFAGGIVAAILIPIIEAFEKEEL